MSNGVLIGLVVIFLVGSWVVLSHVGNLAEWGVEALLEKIGVEQRRKEIAGGLLLVVVLVLVFGVRWGGGKPAEKLPEKPVVSATTAAQGGDCLCASGGVCTGPNGGKFCIAETGNKRYLRGDDLQKHIKNG